MICSLVHTGRQTQEIVRDVEQFYSTSLVKDFACENEWMLDGLINEWMDECMNYVVKSVGSINVIAAIAGFNCVFCESEYRIYERGKWRY